MPTRHLFSSLLLLLLCFAVQQKASATVQVSVHPARAPLTLTQTQQFTATVAGTTNTAVIWFVDGVRGGNSTVGTISSTGSYHPPASERHAYHYCQERGRHGNRRMPRCGSPTIPACLPITVIVFVAE